MTCDGAQTSKLVVLILEVASISGHVCQSVHVRTNFFAFDVEGLRPRVILSILSTFISYFGNYNDVCYVIITTEMTVPLVWSCQLGATLSHHQLCLGLHFLGVTNRADTSKWPPKIETAKEDNLAIFILQNMLVSSMAHSLTAIYEPDLLTLLSSHRQRMRYAISLTALSLQLA